MTRETCGSVSGLLAHQAAGEKPCGTCAYADQVRRISAEGIPARPSSPHCAPVTPQDAAQHRADLLAEVVSWDREQGRRIAVQGGKRRRGGWPLRLVVPGGDPERGAA